MDGRRTVFPQYRGLYRGNNLLTANGPAIRFFIRFMDCGVGVFCRRSSQVVAGRHAGVPGPAGWDCGFLSVAHDIGDRLPPQFSRRLLVTPVPWVSLVGHSRTCRTIQIGVAPGMSGDGCLLLHNCGRKFPVPPVPTGGSTLPLAEKILTCLSEEYGQIRCSNNCETKVSSLSNRAMKSSRAFWKVSSPAV
jgi:hypothetical protein